MKLSQSQFNQLLEDVKKTTWDIYSDEDCDVRQYAEQGELIEVNTELSECYPAVFDVDIEAVEKYAMVSHQDEPPYKELVDKHVEINLNSLTFDDGDLITIELTNDQKTEIVKELEKTINLIN